MTSTDHENDTRLALWFTPQAIRDHYDGDDTAEARWVSTATDDQLADVGSSCLGDDVLYRTFHEVLDAVIGEGL